MRLNSIFIVMALAFTGCKSKTRPIEVGAVKSGPAVALRDLISKNDSLIFGSRHGKMMGQDSDTTIEFKSNGKVVVMEYKTSALDYYGVYIIDDSGGVKISLKEYPGDWPEMNIVLESDNLFLYRKDGVTGVATKEDEKYKEFSNFWPFSRLDFDPEKP